MCLDRTRRLSNTRLQADRLICWPSQSLIVSRAPGRFAAGCKVPPAAEARSVGRRAFEPTRRALHMVGRRYPLAHTAVLLILLVVGCRSTEKLECAYWARESAENPTPQSQELQPRGGCATRRSEGTLAIEPAHLEALSFSDGLASVLTSDGWYYVRADGRNAPVVTYDNGPDYFSEGLARTVRSGKIGFIDKSLSVVIPPSWDFAFPFTEGRAVVCQLCQARPIADGEHSEMIGGSWGYINHVGAVVVPVTFEREELPVPSS